MFVVECGKCSYNALTNVVYNIIDVDIFIVLKLNQTSNQVDIPINNFSSILL